LATILSCGRTSRRCSSFYVILRLFKKWREWEPNIYGGRENLDTISFLKEFNEVYSNFEGFKQLLKKVLHFLWFLDQPLLVVWDEMDDGLDAWYFRIFSKDTVYRKYHQNELTFLQLMFFMPFHDEVVHGKNLS
jgi:1,4-alpha-glucan branching enzyme